MSAYSFSSKVTSHCTVSIWSEEKAATINAEGMGIRRVDRARRRVGGRGMGCAEETERPVVAQRGEVL